MLPMRLHVNVFSVLEPHFSSTFNRFISNQLQHSAGASPVDKTPGAKNVLLQFEDHAVIGGEPQILLVGAGQNGP